MARPKPRTSSLAGRSPVDPPAPASVSTTTASVAPAPSPLEQKTPPPAQTKQPQSQEPRTGKKHPPKVSFYQDIEDTARMRGAFRHTSVLEGDRSLSDFIHKAVMNEVSRREAQYNNGRPFPQAGAGEIPQGRPLGEG
jgi:hypothetical protein